MALPNLLSFKMGNRELKQLHGAPCRPISFPAWLIRDYIRYGRIGQYVSMSRRIPGWTRGSEAAALALASHALPSNCVIIEIGSFLGCSTVLLAGARKLAGSGRVISIDPFDGSGDQFSMQIYQNITSTLELPLRLCFERNIQVAGVANWVEVYQQQAHEVAARWTTPIDLLFLDGDQSYPAVTRAYHSWIPYLKKGGLIALHNSRPGSHHPTHDGHVRLVLETIHPPEYGDVRCVDTTTFARKA